MNSIAWTGDPLMTPELRARLRPRPPNEQVWPGGETAVELLVRDHDVELSALTESTDAAIDQIARERDDAMAALAEMTRWRDEALKEMEIARAERASLQRIAEAAELRAVTAEDERNVAVRDRALTAERLGDGNARLAVELRQTRTLLEAVLMDRECAWKGATDGAALARKLGQALEAVRAIRGPGGGPEAHSIAFAALRSLTGEECRIIGRGYTDKWKAVFDTFSTKQKEMLEDFGSKTPPPGPDLQKAIDLTAALPKKPEAMRTRSSRIGAVCGVQEIRAHGPGLPPVMTCAACGEQADVEFGIKVDGHARPLCAECGDVDGARLGTPQRASADALIRMRIAMRDQRIRS